mgnify:FL=1
MSSRGAVFPGVAPPRAPSAESKSGRGIMQDTEQAGAWSVICVVVSRPKFHGRCLKTEARSTSTGIIHWGRSSRGPQGWGWGSIGVMCRAILESLVTEFRVHEGEGPGYRRAACLGLGQLGQRSFCQTDAPATPTRQVTDVKQQSDPLRSDSGRRGAASSRVETHKRLARSNPQA